jgi:hypothetical protein
MIRPYVLKGVGYNPRVAVEDLEKVFSFWEGKHYKLVGNLVITSDDAMFYAFQTITWDEEVAEYEKVFLKKLEEIAISGVVDFK